MSRLICGAASQQVCSTIFDWVIANYIVQTMHYKKLYLLSKLISKYDIQLHKKLENSYSFRWSIFTKLGMEVEDTYMYQGHLTSVSICFHRKKIHILAVSNTDCLIWCIDVYSSQCIHTKLYL